MMQLQRAIAAACLLAALLALGGCYLPATSPYDRYLPSPTERVMAKHQYELDRISRDIAHFARNEPPEFFVSLQAALDERDRLEKLIAVEIQEEEALDRQRSSESSFWVWGFSTPYENSHFGGHRRRNDYHDYDDHHVSPSPSPSPSPAPSPAPAPAPSPPPPKPAPAPAGGGKEEEHYRNSHNTPPRGGAGQGRER